MHTSPSIVFCFCLGTLFHVANMAYLDVSWFFNLKNGNLTNVTWAHAVNSKSLLSAALNSNIMMIEADVVIGSVNNTNNTDIPIMAHPPSTTSDLSLEAFLADILSFNQHATSSQVKKGVKLDFKSLEAFEDSVQSISSLYNNMTYPVWINADILSGPLNAQTIPVNPTRFFTAAKQFHNSTLSIGWTTNYGENFSATSYTNLQICNMLDTITNNSVNQSITFPVRAGIAAESLTQMEHLLAHVRGSTLTIWSSEGDPVNVTKLRKLIETAGLNKTFIDVPTDLQKQLNLQTIGASSMVMPTLKLVTAIFMLLFVLK